MLLKLKIEVPITVVTVILIFSEYARNRLQNLALSDKWLCAVRRPNTSSEVLQISPWQQLDKERCLFAQVSLLKSIYKRVGGPI